MSKSAYQNLIPWKRGRRLVRQIYQLTDTFPQHELYGLTAQMRRASTSVPLNIAEGNGRLTNGEWQQFLGYARGSLLELESAMILAFDLHYITAEQARPVAELIRSVIKPINGLLRKSTEGFPTKKFPANR
jgi:four helix bundle protein